MPLFESEISCHPWLAGEPSWLPSNSECQRQHIRSTGSGNPWIFIRIGHHVLCSQHLDVVWRTSLERPLRIRLSTIVAAAPDVPLGGICSFGPPERITSTC